MADALVDAVDLAQELLSPATERIYRDDWDAFAEWARARDAPCMPAHPAVVAAYLTHRRGTLGRSGLRLALAAIAHQHRRADHAWSSGDPAIAMVMRAIARKPEEDPGPAGRPAAAHPGPRAAAAPMPAAADWLGARLDWMGQGLTRPPAGPDPRVASYMELMEACLFVLRASGRAAVREAAYQPSRRGLWTVEDALDRVRDSLAGRPEGGRLEGFVPALPAGPDRDLQVRAAVASTLLAELELAREGAVALHQAAPFGKVVLAGAAPSERPQG